jgi:hypothetical protein
LALVAWLRKENDPGRIEEGLKFANRWFFVRDSSCLLIVLTCSRA